MAETRPFSTKENDRDGRSVGNGVPFIDDVPDELDCSVRVARYDEEEGDDDDAELGQDSLSPMLPTSETAAAVDDDDDGGTAAKETDGHGAPEELEIAVPAGAATADKWRKCRLVYYTIILYLSFIGLGMAVAVIGPTLVDLSIVLERPLDEMGLVFVARSSGYFVGSILVAFIFDHGHRLEIFGAVNILSGICVCLAPYTQHFWGFNALICCSGIFTGIIDAGGNVMLLSLWETGSAPYMQALHFFFGLGAFFAPLISEPFLTTHDGMNHTVDKLKSLPTPVMSGSPDQTLLSMAENMTSSTPSAPLSAYLMAMDNVTLGNASNVDLASEAARATVAASIQIPYFIIMAWTVTIGLLFWQLAVGHRFKGTKSPFDRRTNDSGEGTDVPGLTLGIKWFTIFVMSAFFFFYVGMEVAFGQLVFTFGVTSGAQMSKESAAFVNSAYWGTYTATRLASIFIAIFVPPLAMMGADFALVTVAAAVLLGWAETKAGLWVGSALLGIGFASVFPTGIVWYETRVMVTSKIASIFLIGSAAGEMTIPYLSSFLMPMNPMNLVYIVCAVDVGCILAFCLVYAILRRTDADHSR